MVVNMSQTRSPGTGYIIIRTVIADTGLPVPGAEVTVTGGGAEVTAQTGEDGQTPRLPLPASCGAPLSSYRVNVRCEGYYSQFLYNIYIWKNVTVIQSVELAGRF